MIELNKKERGENLEARKTEAKTKKSTSFMKNVVILMCSQLLIKFLGLIYKLVITNIEGFGDTGVGYDCRIPNIFTSFNPFINRNT